MENRETKKELLSQGLMALVLGLSLVAAGIWVGAQLHIVWNVWPSTDGVVVRGTVQEVVDVPHTKGGGPYYSYVPRIEFRYTVGGKTYSTVAPSVYSAKTYDQAELDLSRMYARGTHHPIRYNPRNPRQIQFGIIEFGPLAFAFLLLSFGAFLSAIGLNSLVNGFAQSAEQEPATLERVPARVLSFDGQARPEPCVGTLTCAGCGRPVKANEDNCPNCLKALRAA